MAGSLASQRAESREQLQEWRAAEAPPRSRPLPGAALVAGPSAPPCLLCWPGKISAVSEQLCCGLGGPALRPVSTSGSLCRVLGSGCATAGRVPERWEARLCRPQFPLMGGQAPSQLQVARSCRPRLAAPRSPRRLLPQPDRVCSNRAPLVLPRSTAPEYWARLQISPRDCAADRTAGHLGLFTPQNCPIMPYLHPTPPPAQGPTGPDPWGVWSCFSSQ